MLTCEPSPCSCSEEFFIQSRGSQSLMTSVAHSWAHESAYESTCECPQGLIFPVISPSRTPHESSHEMSHEGVHAQKCPRKCAHEWSGFTFSFKVFLLVLFLDQGTRQNPESEAKKTHQHKLLGRLFLECPPSISLQNTPEEPFSTN